MATRPKILCLHGYTSNSQVHGFQMTPLVEALPEYDFVFPDAPHAVAIESQPIDPNLGMTKAWVAKVEKLSNLGHRAWWYAQSDNWIDAETGNLFGMEESVKAIGRCIEDLQPIGSIVIVGMSQGAAFAAVLCALFDEKNRGHTLRRHLPELLPKPTGVVLGGWRIPYPQYASLYDTGIETPMLHVSGDDDFLVSEERQEELIQACRLPTILRFNGGREVPGSAEDRAKIIEFVRFNAGTTMKTTQVSSTSVYAANLMIAPFSLRIGYWFAKRL